MLRNDADLADAAAGISALTLDISEFLAETGMPDGNDAADLPAKLNVTYHSACSLQHGQKVTTAPKALLAEAGFTVAEPQESHLCCGSAGTYNMLQPEIANQLRDRKAGNIARTAPDVIATGNLGCMMQLQDAVEAPVVHTVELLDWATGGPAPPGAGIACCSGHGKRRRTRNEKLHAMARYSRDPYFCRAGAGCAERPAS